MAGRLSERRCKQHRIYWNQVHQTCSFVCMRIRTCNLLLRYFFQAKQPSRNPANNITDLDGFKDAEADSNMTVKTGLRTMHLHLGVFQTCLLRLMKIHSLKLSSQTCLRTAHCLMSWTMASLIFALELRMSPHCHPSLSQSAYKSTNALVSGMLAQTCTDHVCKCKVVDDAHAE